MVQRKLGAALITVLFLLLFSPCLAGNSQVKYGAILTNLQGRVGVEKGGKRIRVRGAVGMELAPGDRVFTAADASATVYYYTGEITVITEKTRYEILPVKDGKSFEVPCRIIPFRNPEKIFSTTRRKNFVRDIISETRPAGGKGEVSLIQPSYRVLEDHPLFRWEFQQNPESNAVISLEDDNSSILWSKDIAGLKQLSYPETLPSLKPSVTYYWYVRKGNESRENVSNLRSFNIAGDAFLKRLKKLSDDLEKAGANKATRCFILGNFLKSNDYYSAAVKEFEDLADLLPEEGYPHQELIILYHIMGDFTNFEREKTILRKLKHY